MDAKRSRLFALVIAAVAVFAVMYVLGWRAPAHYVAPAILLLAGIYSPEIVYKRSYVWLSLVVAVVAAASFWPYPVPALAAFGLYVGADAVESLMASTSTSPTS